jgi:hypothetical protein
VAETRLAQIKAESGKLYQNLLAGLVSPALRTMITEREAENGRLESRLAILGKAKATADILPHPARLKQFTRKVEALRASLDDDAVRTEAAAVLSTLIESVTI